MPPTPSPAPVAEHDIQGNPDGQTLFFVHGWPDSADLWRHQVAALSDEYRCVCVTLPNFGERSVKRGGFDFPDVVAMLAATVEAVRRDDERITLVTHDWGAYLGYLLERDHPELVERMVAMDIGGHAKPGSAKEIAFIMAYQWTLVGFWLLGGLIPPLGNWLTRRFARLLKVPPRTAERARSRFNYMYFYLWRGMIFPWWRKSLLERYRPSCPVLFLYGKAKPVMFHSQRWFDQVEQSGGRSLGIDGAGHWFMLSHRDEVNHTVSEWLGASPPL